MSAPDLHALANLRGAGKAAEELRKAGHFLDVTEAGSYVWRVTLDVTVEGTTTVTVSASDEAEARKIAVKWADENMGLADIDDLEPPEFYASDVSPGDVRDIVP